MHSLNTLEYTPSQVKTLKMQKNVSKDFNILKSLDTPRIFLDIKEVHFIF
jgi:archaellum component FlaC